jgi:hypothetical protein
VDENDMSRVAAQVTNAVRSSLAQTPIAELEDQILRKIKDGRFVDPRDGYLELFSVGGKCERCAAEVRVGDTRTAPIAPIRAIAAGLSRVKEVMPLEMLLEFHGGRDEFASFMRRSPSESESRLIDLFKSAGELRFCLPCGELGKSQELLRERYRGPRID